MLNRLAVFLGMFALCLTMSGALPVAAQTLPGVDVGGTMQTTPIYPADLSQEDVRDMVSRMSDTEVRDMLLERLDAVAKRYTETAEGTSVAVFLGAAAAGVWGAVYEAIVRLPLLVSSQSTSFQNF